MRLPDPQDDPDFYAHVIAKRLLAWAVDLVVTLVLVLLVLVMTAFLATLMFPVIWAAVSIVYRAVMLRRYRATLGMMVAALRLVRLDGGRPDPDLCTWHAVLYSLTMVFVVPQVVSVGLMLTTPYRQGLNDWLLGTTLVNRFVEG